MTILLGEKIDRDRHNYKKLTKSVYREKNKC